LTFHRVFHMFGIDITNNIGRLKRAKRVLLAVVWGKDREQDKEKEEGIVVALTSLQTNICWTN